MRNLRPGSDRHRSGAHAVVDPYQFYQPHYQAFLDQGRWLLEQQQRRSDVFQQGAIALVGFDGILIAILASGDALGSTTRYSAAWWAVIAGAGLFLVSALCGVVALIPRQTNTVPAASTVRAWREFRREGGFDRDALRFADMLLASKPKAAASRPTWGLRLRARARKLLALPKPKRQPLRAAEQLASVRGTWTLRAGVLLIAGLFALLVVLIVSPVPTPNEGQQPQVTTEGNSQ